MFRFQSLRSRMLLGAVGALVLFMGISVHRAYERRIEDVEAALARLQVQVDVISSRHADILRNTHTLIIALLTDLDVNTFGTNASCSEAMGKLLAREPAIDNIGLTLLDGLTVCNGRNNPPVNLSEYPFFQQALRARGTVIGAPVVAPYTGNWVLPFAGAISDASGNPEAMLTATVSLPNLLDEFSRSGYLQQARMGIVNADGVVLAHYPDPKRMVGQDISDEPFFHTIIKSGDRGTGEEPGLDGEPRLFAFARLPETESAPVYVWVAFYKSAITGNADRVFMQLLVINVAIAVFFFLLFLFVWENQIMRPLTAVMQAAQRLSKGDYQARSGVRPKTEEFGTLARLFDEMADSLSSKAEVLQLNRALRVLSGCAEYVVRARDEHELLLGVCRTIVEKGNYGYAWIGFAENDEAGSVRVDAWFGGILDETIKRAKPVWKDGPSGKGPAGIAIRTGLRQVVQDLGATTGPLLEWQKATIESGMRAAVVLPLLHDGVAFGVIAIFAGKTHVFTEAELDLLDELAEDITYGIQTRRVELDRQRAEVVAERLAKIDPVTELPNRVELIAHLQKHLGRANAANEPIAVLSVGIDRLIDVQDAIGIAGADDVLRQFADRLCGHMAGIHFVARNDAASLAIVAPLAIEDPASVARVVHEITEEPFEYAGIPIGLQTTVGVALFPEHGNDPDALLRRADIAVRHARAASNDYEVYRGASDSENPKHLTMLADLRKAIRDGELVLFYQPKVSTAASPVVLGVEALVRWNSPVRGMVPPGHFISLAENTGLIKPLTYWVIGAAMKQLALWQLVGNSTRIAVNVSQFNLRDPDFYEQFMAMPEKFNAKLEGLDIEITESALMEDPVHARAVLERLSKLGVRIFIDDFGTGYSSLSYLATLPIHALKIDRAFVIQMHEPRYHTIVQSTISMAHSLSMKVVAEGVETLELVQALAELGCDDIQGYFYSKPLPVEKLEPWCEQFGKIP